MKKRIYIETSVVSYLTARPSREIMIAGHQEATRDIWPEFVAKEVVVTWNFTHLNNPFTRRAIRRIVEGE